MSTPAKRRLLKDLDAIKSSADENLYAQPLDNDMLTWAAVIAGPQGTAYEGGTFSLMLLFDEKYPNSPPEVSFISEMFHPNIYVNGDLCLDLLKSKWSSSYDVAGVLMSIQSLLNDPNVMSPANAEAAKLFDSDYAEYEKRVKETVEKSWTDVETKYIQEFEKDK
ncbi:ubiquitin-conjugating enzyme E2 A [Enteropsectra breve]|nr:ubiquitin-conjugating enzyme E2 A [Enteropsectra breve]